jgi:hypothetical protein
MDAQHLATLQSLMTDAGLADLDPSRLEPFYRHCARLPLAHDGRQVSLPLKSLLLNYAHLRPELKTSLDKALHERWRRFAAETPSSPPRVAIDQPATEPAWEPALPPKKAPSTSRHPFSQPVKEDWFGRLLTGVRCLFLLPFLSRERKGD